MGAPIIITVPGAPVAKGRPRIGKGPGGRPMAYTPAKTKAYEAQVLTCAAKAMNGAAPLDGPLVVKITAALAIPKSWSKAKKMAAERVELLPTGRPDLDNFIKAALDGLNGVAFVDDSQVVRLDARKIYSARPRLEIVITQASGG